jgi:P4 family phage/plasmid primase-like protien
MSLFQGTHEIRLLLRVGIAVGYFNSWEAALQAVENEPSQYKAAYYTLNPVKLTAGIPVNPSTIRVSGNAASASDIERRVWLLIDLDPLRPSKSNSTEDEKQTALDQAMQVREWLFSRGWPQPVLADSGNGIHLLYRVDLPNDEASTALLKSFLARLRQLFPLVDAGNFDASRVCKLYGTWARKAEHTEARPHRRSAIIEAPATPTLVSYELINAVAAEYQAPESKTGLMVSDGNVKLQKLIAFLEHYAVNIQSAPRPITNGHQIAIDCPWEDEHSDSSHRDCVVSYDGIRGFGFKCLHSHCTERHWKEFRAVLERRNPGLPPFFRSLPRMTHADIARDFTAENEDFCTVYNAPRSPIAAWVGTRWDIGDDGGRLLRKAIRFHLDALYHRYPAPEEGKKDYRLALLSAPFATNVLTEVRPLLPPVRHEVFDSDEYALGLPGGRVVDLRTGDVRPMEREDCITKRLYMAPEGVATPRWDRFLEEITLGKRELAEYLVRLCALCLSGMPYHGLFFLWGRGRNGKGVLLRQMMRILGEGVFAVSLRPSEVTANTREDSDSAKRTFAKFEGMRLATVQETVGSRLNLPMLKILSGGDTLSGAKMRQDDVQFAPTHKLLLPTNDKPDLPADPAFRGRVHFIPFLANYSDVSRQDKRLESDLKGEAAGVLYKLIAVCPDVIQNGLLAPRIVRDATDGLFEDLDFTKQFIEERVQDSPGSFVGRADMETAVRQWVGLIVGDNDRRVTQVLDGLKARYAYDRRRIEGGERPWGFVGIELTAKG